MLHKKFFVVSSTFVALASTTSYANASVVKPISFQMAVFSFGAEEVMFAQIMIPHHKQAIQMSKFALAKAGVARGTNMEMQGMLTDQQLKVLEKLKGSKFDKLYLSQMIFHHQGALQSVSIIANSRNIEAKALASSIKSTQSAEISAMKSMLAAIK